MASISGTSGTTSSLSTTLRGFGGMASGIDRDSIIEQMSMGTTTKIQNQKNAITSLTWKQEAFRGIIDKILNIQDNYLSYSAKTSVKDANLFAKNMITANGDEKVTKYVSVSGSSDLLENMSIKGVENLATSANIQSGELGSGEIVTGMGFSDQPQYSLLSGSQLVFGYYGTENKFYESGTFTFPSSYKDENNKVHNIDYMPEKLEDLAKQLNEAVKANEFKLKEDITVQFRTNAAGDKLEMYYAEVKNNAGFEIGKETTRNDIVIRSNSSALSALGFKKDLDGADPVDAGKGYTLDQYNQHVDNTLESYVYTYKNMADYLKGKKFTVAYGGQSKQVELITKAEAEALTKKQASIIEEYKKDHPDATEEELKKEVDGQLNEEFRRTMQSHMDKAFGTGKIAVGVNTDGKITFDDAKGEGATLTVTSSDYSVMKQTGLDQMSSNKLSMDSSLYDNRTRFGFDEAMTKEEFSAALQKFEINGVSIKATADMSVNQLLMKINDSDAGVKATYLNTSNKFTLVSKETGSGREIQLGGGAERLFGGADSVSADGKDAVMYVDYGTGAERIVSSSNTFSLDGLKITVSGEFGVERNEDGEVTDSNGDPIYDADGSLIKGKIPRFDNTKAVTFNASANIDKAVEAVKKFVEDYNELVKAINTEITTKPDKSYGPLSDEQKDEMNETSIENWEKKAKSGLLYNNSIMRDLSLDMQGILTKVMGSGVSYDDLEEIGITGSEDIYDGGTLTFNEEKFKAAMKDDPEKVGNIFTGGGDVSKGLSSIVEDTLKQYATRYSYQNNGSYGRLVEEAGSEKLTLSMQNNTIYKQLKDMETVLTNLKSKLKTEQDRYIQMFTTMEQAISNMNSQSSYLSSISG